MQSLWRFASFKHGISPGMYTQVVAFASLLLLLISGCGLIPSETPTAVPATLTAAPAEGSASETPSLTLTQAPAAPVSATITDTPTHAATAAPDVSSVQTTVPVTQVSKGDTPTTAAARGGGVTAKVQDILRVRSGPGTQYAILGKLAVGTQVSLLARSADGQWYVIAFPPGSTQRGWINSGFVLPDVSTANLPTEQAPPTATPTATTAATPTELPSPTLEATDPCAPIPGQAYGTLAIDSGPTDRPAATHPDLNLELRGYAPTNAAKALINIKGAPDPGAPQLRSLFQDRRLPTITGVYQVYAWDWNANGRGPLIDDPQVTLLGARTTASELIGTPDAGGNLGNGYVALVLYASQNRITLKYTREDHVVNGYTIHLENVCVEPSLLALYQQMNSAKRRELPALRAGQPLGRATGAELGVVVRDRGTFMDPRSRGDWWVR
jgi:uncharacterized protein YgiM (DUF1202 family)